MYRAKVVAEEGRKLRPNQTIPAMQKHTHMMKRTLRCPALRAGTVGYQLSPHTHTQQHHTLDYYNSTPYMYIHKMWSFRRADLQGCFYSTYMYVHVHCATCSQPHGRQLPLGGPTVGIKKNVPFPSRSVLLSVPSRSAPFPFSSRFPRFFAIPFRSVRFRPFNSGRARLGARPGSYICLKSDGQRATQR